MLLANCTPTEEPSQPESFNVRYDKICWALLKCTSHWVLEESDCRAMLLPEEPVNDKVPAKVNTGEPLVPNWMVLPAAVEVKL